MTDTPNCDLALPRVELFVHADHALPDGFELDRVGAICLPVVPEVLRLAKADSPLGRLEEIEVTLVSDGVIADVHLEFMDVEGATDVITFDHGEILISTDTASAQAAENENSVERETALYVVHGLLHLAGYADKTELEFAEMARLQEMVILAVWPR